MIQFVISMKSIRSAMTLVTKFLAMAAVMSVAVYAEGEPGAVDSANGNGSVEAGVNTSGDNKNSADVLELYFFGSATCGECKEIKVSLLQPLEQEFAGKLKINHYYYDIGDTNANKLLFSLDKRYNVTNPAPQELFLPDTVLLGYESIMAHGRAMIEEYLNDPQRRLSVAVSEPVGDLNAEIKKRFDKFAFLSIVLAALVDAINPCAIATIIFLVSFLATQKRKRIEVLTVGLAFAGTVFVTYLLLGIGAFKAITMLQQYYWVSQAIRWSAVTLAGIVGLISIIDALRFKKSGDAKEITLQLPKSVKLRIHKIITENMKGNRLIVGTIITGFLVTLLEAVCTGQVYLPTIVMMTQSSNGEMKLIGWLYLIMYNFIFVIPLLAVMVAAYYGMKWTDLSKLMQKHMTLVKLLLGIVMIGLALYLAFA